MDWLSAFIARFGGAALFLFAFAEMIGAPFPAFAVFVLAGALAAAGTGSVTGAVAGAVLGAIAADLIWYGAGRWRGRALLSTLCRVTLNPDACVERTESTFGRRRTATLLFAKFLPGVNTMVPPLAGVASFPLPRFLLLDFLGTLIWAFAGVGLGWVFGSGMASRARAVHGVLGWLIVAGTAAYFIWQVGYRYYLVHRFSVPRIEPEDLHRKMSAEDGVLVLDLRSDAAYADSSVMIAGAVRVRPATFHRYVHELPRDRELVFYCT